MDLEIVHCEWLEHRVRKSQNTFELVGHLRRGGLITPDLSNLIADVLEDKIRPRPKPKAPTAREHLTNIGDDGIARPNALMQGFLDYYKKMLKNPTEDEFDWAQKSLAKCGGMGSIETKGQRTRVAERLLALRCGLTISQLDEILRPRTIRVKNR